MFSLKIPILSTYKHLIRLIDVHDFRAAPESVSSQGVLHDPMQMKEKELLK